MPNNLYAIGSAYNNFGHVAQQQSQTKVLDSSFVISSFVLTLFSLGVLLLAKYNITLEQTKVKKDVHSIKLARLFQKCAQVSLLVIALSIFFCCYSTYGMKSHRN